MATEIEVIVTGGRDYADRERVYKILDAVREFYGQIDWLKHGGATGADTLADEWAAARGVNAVRFPADWETHGRAAGPIRNQDMVDDGAIVVVAFPGGRGTADLMKRARRAGITVMEIA